MAVGNVLFLIGVILATVLMFANLTYVYWLARQVQEPVGRILFGTLASLKVWVALVLSYLVVISFFGAFIGPSVRAAVRWGLLVYLLVQSTSALAAWEHWRRNP